jgi:hypothetical protein
MHPPRKRLVVPYYSSPESITLLDAVRDGARTMSRRLDGASSLFQRDFLDLLTWIAVRQAQVFEAEAMFPEAKETWMVLRDALTLVPELSIVESVRSLSRGGALSRHAENSLWTLACDFYHGYPLVLSPEAIELVYVPQLDSARTGGLDEPGWFWHDFPEPGWADSVRKLPAEDAEEFEREIRSRLGTALSGPEPASPAPRSEVAVLLDATQRLDGAFRKSRLGRE